MTEYQLTIGYKAVICVTVKAEDENEAEKAALEIMKKQRDKFYAKRGFDLQDDNYKVNGVLNMDETWNML